MRYQGKLAQIHPSAQTLSLFSGGDLPWTMRLSLSRHLRRCTECEQQVNVFRSSKAELRREASAQALTGFEAIADWNRLEREMLGNVAVGVAAARCVDHVRPFRALLWRGAFVLALVALFAAGWVTHIPKEDTGHLAASLRRLVGIEPREFSGTVVRSTPDGVTVRAQGAALTIMHPPSAVLSLSGSSGVAARYVDEETGEVTITTVYGQ